jgi:hypothetical protein
MILFGFLQRQKTLVSERVVNSVRTELVRLSLDEPGCDQPVG